MGMAVFELGDENAVVAWVCSGFVSAEGVTGSPRCRVGKGKGPGEKGKSGLDLGGAVVVATCCAPASARAPLLWML